MSVSKLATRAPTSSTRTGEGTLRPLTGSPEGGLPAPEEATFAPVEDFLGPRVAGFVVGASLLLPGAADFGGGPPPPPPLGLAERIPDPNDRSSLLCSVLTTLLHHCRHNSSNIPSVWENLQVTSHTRRKYVFASCAGDRNILWPSTPVTFSIRAEDSRSSGEDILPPGAAHVPINSTTKLSETPTPPLQYLFSLLSGRGSLLRRPFLGHVHRFLPAAVGSVFPGIATVWQAV
jgi:hypothetical protein